MQDENLIPKSNYPDLTQRNPVTYRAPLASNTAENNISTTRQIGKSPNVLATRDGRERSRKSFPGNNFWNSTRIPWILRHFLSVGKDRRSLLSTNHLRENQSRNSHKLFNLVNILVGFIVLAIIGVSILIVCLYRTSKQNRFSKSRKSNFDPEETDSQSKSVEDSHDDDLIIKKISIPEEKAKFLPENIWTERLYFR